MRKLVTDETVSAVVAHMSPESHIVGFMIIRQVLDEAEILSIAVAPEVRQSGIGKTMCEFILTELARAEVGKLFLEVDESNLAARLFYKKNAFTEVGVRRGYYPGNGSGREDAIVMMKCVPQTRLATLVSL
jgi:ribosomal-protein-alanine N-acetyltransferase